MPRGGDREAATRVPCPPGALSAESPSHPALTPSPWAWPVHVGGLLTRLPEGAPQRQVLKEAAVSLPQSLLVRTSSNSARGGCAPGRGGTVCGGAGRGGSDRRAGRACAFSVEVAASKGPGRLPGRRASCWVASVTGRPGADAQIAQPGGAAQGGYPEPR